MSGDETTKEDLCSPDSLVADRQQVDCPHILLRPRARPRRFFLEVEIALAILVVVGTISIVIVRVLL